MATTVGSPINTNDFSARIAAVEADVAALEAGWTAFTPTFRLGTNNLTLGNGTLIGRYRIIGDIFVLRADLIWGSTSSWPVNDTLNLQLPFSVSSGNTPGALLGGAVRAEDVSTPARARGWPEIGISPNAVVVDNYDASGYWDGDTPIVWADGDTLRFYVIGEAP